MQTLGSIVLGVGVVIPAMIITGFMPEWDVLPLWAWTVIAALSGGIGIALLVERLRGLAFMAGFIGGAGALIGMVIYVPLRAQLSESFFTIEFVIPCVLGGLPGFILYGIGSRLLPKKPVETP